MRPKLTSEDQEICLYLILLTGSIITRELRVLLDKLIIIMKKKPCANLKSKLHSRRQEAGFDSCGLTTLKYIYIMREDFGGLSFGVG